MLLKWAVRTLLHKCLLTYGVIKQLKTEIASRVRVTQSPYHDGAIIGRFTSYNEFEQAYKAIGLNHAEPTVFSEAKNYERIEDQASPDDA